MPKQNHNLNKISSLLNTMFKLQHNVDSLLLTQIGIGLSANRILSAADSANPLSQRKISGILGQTEANISRQIRHMASDGLVKIAPDKKDKRQRQISLTSKGSKKLATAHQLLTENSNYLLRQIKNI